MWRPEIFSRKATWTRLTLPDCARREDSDVTSLNRNTLLFELLCGLNQHWTARARTPNWLQIVSYAITVWGETYWKTSYGTMSAEPPDTSCLGKQGSRSRSAPQPSQ